MSRKLWIAWEDDTSIRSRVLAEELGARYRAYTRFSESKGLWWLRYIAALAETALELLRFRPTLLVVQNPSIVLAFEAALLKPLFRYDLLIDLHTPFNNPRGLKKRVADFVHTYGLRHCSGIIVTNERFKAVVEEQTPKPVFVLPDKVPELESAAPVELRGRRNVLYICTYSKDEPWARVVEAVELLPPDVCIYISGKGPLVGVELPANLIATGYLPRHEYEGLLQSVDAVMVLTTAEDNLVCGGYEAVAIGTPLILSDTTALRGLFGRGAVFTANEPAAIADTLGRVLRDLDELRGDMATLRREMDDSWHRRWLQILRAYDADDGSHAGPGRSRLGSV